MPLLLQRFGMCSNDFDVQYYYPRTYFDLLKCYVTESLMEEPSNVELKVELGEQIISELPTDFKLRNNGKFTAITFTGKILVVKDTLEELNKQLAKMDLAENYYIKKLGFETIAQL
ncbi:MAG: hypothetical protein WC325_03515 [Candidatus Bathyarchaeia archaeon]|jgi:hypothetical protein